MTPLGVGLIAVIGIMTIALTIVFLLDRYWIKLSFREALGNLFIGAGITLFGIGLLFVIMWAWGQ